MPFIDGIQYKDDLWAAAEKLVPKFLGLEPAQTIYMSKEASTARVKEVYSTIERKLTAHFGTIEHLNFSFEKPQGENFTKIKFV